MPVSCLTEGLGYIGRDCSWIWSTASWADKCGVWFKGKQNACDWACIQLLFIMARRGFFNGCGLWVYWITVCACCPVVSEFVTRASLHVNGAAAKSMQFPTWPHGGSVTFWLLSNGSTPGESELPFAASPSRFCWRLRLGCGPRWAHKDERCSVRLGIIYSLICSRKSERKRCLSSYAVFRPKHSHDQPTDPQSLNLWINKQSWVCVSHRRHDGAVRCDAETYVKSH